MSFVCPRCDVVLHDGVDYTWCPSCSQPVDWVDPRGLPPTLPPRPPRSSSAKPSGLVEAMSALTLTALLAQIVVLALDPIGFVFVVPVLLAAVLGAGAFLITLLGSLGELAALARDHRTRVIHGLEHACLRLLERRGLGAGGGRTHDGFFEIEVANDGRASIEAVRQATFEAMTRLAAGDASLAFDPRCGTSLIVGIGLVSAVVVAAAITGLLAGVPVGILTAGTAAAGLLAWLGSRPLGLLVQRTFTVSTRFADAAVKRIVRVISASGDTATFLVYLCIEERAVDRAMRRAR
jgi:hypothetical protein